MALCKLLIILAESSKDMVNKVTSLRLVSDTELHACELICPKLCNNIFYSVVSSGTSLRAHTQLTNIKAYIIIHHYKMVNALLVIVDNRSYALTT